MLHQPSNSLSGTVDRYIYHLRIPLLLATLLWAFYIVNSLWTAPVELFSLVWYPDTKLMVEDVRDPAATPLIQEDDIIIAVDGQVVERTEPVFPIIKDNYELTIQRGNELLTTVIHVPLGPTPLGSADYSLIAFTAIMWLSALFMFVFATKESLDALRVGSFFLLFAVWVISFRGSLSGVPLAWLAGHSLGFVAGVSLVYMAFLFGEPPSAKTTKVFKFSFGIAALFALIGLLEVFLFYPNSSIEAFTGISWVTMGVRFVGIGLLAHLVILVARYVRTRQPYQRRQLGLLIFFISVGGIPTILLTVLPSAATQHFNFFVLEIATALILLIPTGYVFVTNRARSGRFDKVIVNLITSGVIVLVLVILYESVLRVTTALVQPGSTEEIFNYALVGVVPLTFLVAKMQTPLSRYAENLVYGKQAINEATLGQFTAAIASHPDIQTLEDILTRTAKEMNIPQAVMALFHGENEVLYLSNQQNLGNELAIGREELESVTDNVSLRPGAARTGIFQRIIWANTIVPLTIRSEPIGALIVSTPLDEPFINEKQLTILSLVAGVIAVGYDRINLFESSLELSARLLQARDQERKEIASNIHDDPLATIASATNEIERVYQSGRREDHSMERAITNLREACEKLRRICQGLRPSILGHGVELALKEVIQKFRRDNPNIHVETQIEEMEGVSTDDDVVAAVYYISKEALTNVARHSKATAVKIALSYDTSTACITISDNGKGSPKLNLSVSELWRHKHYGLIGMKERAKAANATLFIREASPSGIIVSLEIPITTKYPSQVSYANG